MIKKLMSAEFTVSADITSKNFFAPAPAVIGPESIKANFAASSLFRFKKSPAEIVAPEREMPGIRARDWAKPIITDST